MKFSELNLSEQTLAGIERVGFTECTKVQEMVLPTSLQGRDVMAQSKTGSGKTAVFLITVFEKYLKKKAAGEESVALVISPTRELAVQIEEDARILSCAIPDYRIGCFFGGVGYKKQDEAISRGCDLYIGTPGRLLDYMQMQKLDFRRFDTFVIDEADRLFDMGFFPDVKKMLQRMVEPKDRQTMLFSATLESKVRNLAWSYMNSPEEFEATPNEITVSEITQELYHVPRTDKFEMLLRIMSSRHPESALIFTNMKHTSTEIAKRLQKNGFQCEYIMGDMPQSKRLAVIEDMKNGKTKILVATDVAARGLQIDNLEMVINYDLPEDYENYVHRIGRTARAGKSGTAISLADEEGIYSLEPIETYIKMKIPVIWPDEESLPLVEDKSAGMKFSSYDADRPRSASRGSRGSRGTHGSSSSDGRSSGRRSSDRRGSDRGGSDKRGSERPARRPAEKRPKHLGAMTEEERLSYYSRKYGETEKYVKTPSKKSVSKPAKEAAMPKPAEKKGFFAWLRGLFR